MSESKVIELLNDFNDSRDPNKIIHPLPTVLFISICAIFCGAEGWEDIVMWGSTNIKWLSKYVDMSEGVPSYSTIRRVFTLILPVCWGKLIESSISSAHPNKVPEDHVPIDGKTLRGSKCKSKEIRAMQFVSAWSVSNNLILGEVKTDSKSNEIKAIPLLLDLLDLEGATVSLDAIGCNEKIISMLLDKGSHYAIGLKKNQPKLYEAVEAYAKKEGCKPKNLVHDEFDDSHGRCIRRRYFAFEPAEMAKSLGFSQMNTIIATETISSSKYQDGVKAEWRYYVTNHSASKDNLAGYVRNHWQIESLHWCLDVHLDLDPFHRTVY